MSSRKAPPPPRNPPLITVVALLIRPKDDRMSHHTLTIFWPIITTRYKLCNTPYSILRIQTTSTPYEARYDPPYIPWLRYMDGNVSRLPIYTVNYKILTPGRLISSIDSILGCSRFKSRYSPASFRQQQGVETGRNWSRRRSSVPRSLHEPRPTRV